MIVPFRTRKMLLYVRNLDFCKQKQKMRMKKGTEAFWHRFISENEEKTSNNFNATIKRSARKEKVCSHSNLTWHTRKKIQYKYYLWSFLCRHYSLIGILITLISSQIPHFVVECACVRCQKCDYSIFKLRSISIIGAEKKKSNKSCDNTQKMKQQRRRRQFMIIAIKRGIKIKPNVTFW